MFLSGNFSGAYSDFDESYYREDMEINETESDYTKEDFDFEASVLNLFQNYTERAFENEKCKVVPLDEFVCESVICFCNDIDGIFADTIDKWYKLDDWDEGLEEPYDPDFVPKDIKLSVERRAIDKILDSIVSGEVHTDWHYMRKQNDGELGREDITEILKQLTSPDYIYKMEYENILRPDNVLTVKIKGKDFKLPGDRTANDVTLYIKTGDSDDMDVTLLSMTCSKEPKDFPHSSAKARNCFNHYCIGKIKGRKSTEEEIYYDFTERKEYLDYESRISKKTVAARNDPDMFIKDLRNSKEVLTAFEKLFYEDKTLVFALSCNFTYDNDDNYYGESEGVRVCLCPSKENHTKTYSGRTMDFLIQTADDKTVALFPIDADILKAELNEIIYKIFYSR